MSTSVNKTEIEEAILEGLMESKLVLVKIDKAAQHFRVGQRSVQRYLKYFESNNLHVISFREEHASLRHYMNRRDLAENGGEFADFRAIKNSPNYIITEKVVAPVAPVAPLSYIYIYTKREDLRSAPTGATTQTTPPTPNGNGASESLWSATSWVDDVEGDFSALVAAVCDVCKINPILLEDDDEKRLMKFFKAEVDPQELIKRYSFRNKPNFWSNYGPGRYNRRPTLVDISKTWDRSGDYVFQPHHAWPTNQRVWEQIREVMIEYRRDQPKKALEAFDNLGYSRIIESLKLDYYSMTTMSEHALKMKIFAAIKAIKDSELQQNPV